MLGRHCTANKESGHLDGASSINIDHWANRSQHGGGHADFMDAASRTAGCTVELRLDRTRGGDSRRGSLKAADEESAATNADKRACLNFVPALPKRGGCDSSAAPKRVCFQGATARAPCGVPGSGLSAPCNGLILSCTYNGSVKAGQRMNVEDEGTSCRDRRPCVSRCDRSGTLVKHALLYRPPATENSAVNVGANGLGVGAAKGRVRLYRICSFISPTPGNGKGLVTEDANGILSFAQDSVDPTLVRTCSSSAEDLFEEQETGVRSGGSSSGKLVNGNAYRGLQACGDHTVAADEGQATHHADRAAHGCDKPVHGAEISESAHCRELVEIGADAARRRQVRLEERTEGLRRRLRALRVTQVQKHVAQQLQGLGRTALPPAGSGQLHRLARSCSELLRTVEGGLDSDQTASSSGGESDVEEQAARRIRPSKPRVQDSPEWRWVQERAWLGSRWAWLHANVSELEYRIRGLSQLYVHLRQAKGRRVHHQPTATLRHPKDAMYSAAGPCPYSRMREPPHSAEGSSSARVRAIHSHHRHRLISLGNPPALAPKVEIMACSCQPPTSCVLCSRTPAPSPFDTHAPPLVQAARLDLGLHPVLSSPSDVHLNLHSGAILKTIPIIHNAMRSFSRLPPPSCLAGGGQSSYRTGRTRRRALCRQPRPLQFGIERVACCQVRGSAWSTHRIPSMDLCLPTPSTHDTSIQPHRRRREETSFDIDNLVMPLGLAGLGGGARLQRPQYKEILTPRWRLLNPEDQASHTHLSPEVTTGMPVEEDQEEDEEVEDLSDAAFRSRHTQLECKEKGRWGRWSRRRPRGRATCRGTGRMSRLVKPRCNQAPDWCSWPASLQETSGRTTVFVPEDEEQAVSPWERRSFPLSEPELRWLEEEEEEGPPLETHNDLCGPSACNQSTDSGISVGSLELSPVTPPHSPQSMHPQPTVPMSPHPSCPHRDRTQ